MKNISLILMNILGVCSIWFGFGLSAYALKDINGTWCVNNKQSIMLYEARDIHSLGADKTCWEIKTAPGSNAQRGVGHYIQVLSDFKTKNINKADVNMKGIGLFSYFKGLDNILILNFVDMDDTSVFKGFFSNKDRIDVQLYETAGMNDSSGFVGIWVLDKVNSVVDPDFMEKWRELHNKYHVK